MSLSGFPWVGLGKCSGAQLCESGLLRVGDGSQRGRPCRAHLLSGLRKQESWGLRKTSASAEEARERVLIFSLQGLRRLKYRGLGQRGL